MAKVKNSKKKKSGISVDLSGVETGGRAIPEGVYTIKVNEAELTESQTGNPMVKFVFEVIEGKNKGAKLFENCSLQPQALFKLKNLLMALGYDIPEGAFDLEVDDLLDLECQVEVAHEKYEGKTKSRIVEYIGEDEEDEDSDDEEDEEDEEEDEEDEDEEEDEEDFESMTLKELKALAKERGIKVDKKMDKDAIIEALEDSDEDEDDEEEEDDEEGEDYSAMSLKDLKALARERGIKVKKGMGKDEIVEALEEDDEE